MSSEGILSQAPPPADTRISYGSDPLQFIDFYFPKGNTPYPLVLFIHGGFWRAKYDLTHAGHLCAALANAGIATANIEYRRVGNPGGGWPGSLEDIEAALQSISTAANNHHFNLNRVAVMGHSAGGQLALALASRGKNLRGVVALAPVSNLRRAYYLHLSNDAVGGFLGGTP
ncbi:MAG: alpha/beta hydrolase, partial [Terriglobales bacterium]